MNQRLNRFLTAAALLTVSFALVMTAYAAQAAEVLAGAVRDVGESPNGIYIVRMAEDPVVAYEGGILGIKATKPRNGKKIDPNSPTVIRYVDHLRNRHDKALAKVGGKKVSSYFYSFNGFAAKMSREQANRMKSFSGVVAVSADKLHTIDTATTPEFLGLTEPGSLWDQLGGHGSAGEDIIIGIIDSGIWPENPSFSDRTGTNGNGRKDGKLDYQQIPGWHGKCTPGEAFPASMCNQKLIGAQRFNASWGGDAGLKAARPWEFASPRDYHGHGSHVGGTSGGNYDTPLNGPAAELLGSVHSMAPRARISTYKALWSNQDASQASGFTGDLVAAIDQAVADGVDVINYSISGVQDNFLDSVGFSFLFAANAGVSIATSAGNSGPTPGSVAHPYPWTTTVGASTHDRNFSADAALGDGNTYTGASFNTTGAGPADLVYSADVGMADADPEEVRLCVPGTLDEALVAGKIVLCDRGAIARVDKSLAVYMAGGIGMIHANANDGDSTNADIHSVPTVHVVKADGDAIRSYATTDAAPTAQIFPAYPDPQPAPLMASFSSRGPLQAGSGDVLKPDVTAPGVDIMAAVAPPGNGGADFSAYSGTSMSAPHVAGLSALLQQAHPDWSPMMVKSALMTTATDTLDGPDPFAQGAGHVNPNSAFDPGLVFDAGWLEWLAFLCGSSNAVGQGTCDFLAGLGFSDDPSDMNVASIAIGAMAGVQTVTRTVTSVGNSTEMYDFSYTLEGVDVAASPSSFELSPGESQTIEITFLTTTAPVNAYTTGHAYWTGDGGHMVRIPLAIQPVQIAAPDELHESGTDGSTSFDVTFGYDGAYAAAAHGLEPATRQDGNVADDPTNNINSALATCDFDAPFPYPCTGITWHAVSVPAGTAYTRISLFDAYTDGADDLDLYVWGPDGGYVGGSGSGTSAEEVNVPFPAPGIYEVAVHGWGTDGPDANYTLFDWSVSATPGGNLSVDNAPAAAALGEIGTLDISWGGADPDTKHMGAVSHSDGSALIGLTLIRVDTD